MEISVLGGIKHSFIFLYEKIKLFENNPISFISFPISCEFFSAQNAIPDIRYLSFISFSLSYIYCPFLSTKNFSFISILIVLVLLKLVIL